MDPESTSRCACVFAPSPLLTITVEESPEGSDEIHVHPGGQGLWIARMLSVLGLEVDLCASFGGEMGDVARHLVSEQTEMSLLATATAGSNGAYVHDRRGGEREEVADMPAATLTRHEVDELFGAALVSGIEADVCVLAGHVQPEVVPADVYRRLAADISGYGTPVVVDLSREDLEAAVEGGASVVKVSHEELLRDGRVQGDSVDDLVDFLHSFAKLGPTTIVVTRADEGALALADGALYEVVAPRLEAVDTRGAGDSFTAGLATALACGRDAVAGLRLGAAAGALNVTRRGLATGRREEIEQLADHIEVRPIG